MLEDDLRVIVEKAKVLTEALPYIRDFHGKTIVIKAGSSVLRSQSVTESVMSDAALLKLIGMRPIIVHSGSDEISRHVKNAGKSIEFLEGHRVTDKDTMDIVEMVLGKINKDLVAILEKNGVHSVGICGKDNSTIMVEKKEIKSGDVGFFGKITQINTELIDKLLDDDFIPIIASIGIDENYESYNLNADDVATETAKAINAEKLIFLAKESGIYRNLNDPTTLAFFMEAEEAEEIAKSGGADKNVLSKLLCAIDAAKSGVNRVHIINGSYEHGMLLEFFTNDGIGTAIYNKGEKANG